MLLNLYHTNDENNTINKTLEKITELNIHLSQNANLDSLSLRLLVNDYDYKNINYARINNNYYFAKSVFLNNKVYALLLTIDYLETYKNTILDSSLDIKRKSEAGSNISQKDITQEITTKIYKSSVKIEKGSSIIVQTVSGKKE